MLEFYPIFIKFQWNLWFWTQKCVPGGNGPEVPIKRTRNTWYFDIAARTRTFLQKSRNFVKFTKFLKNHGISRNPEKCLGIAEFPEKCGSRPPPRPRPNPDIGGFEIWAALHSRAPGRSAPGPRESGPEPTGIRPRADGNPAPSRQKSCPDPDPLPPFF